MYFYIYIESYGDVGDVGDIGVAPRSGTGAGVNKIE